MNWTTQAVCYGLDNTGYISWTGQHRLYIINWTTQVVYHGLDNTGCIPWVGQHVPTIVRPTAKPKQATSQPEPDQTRPFRTLALTRITAVMGSLSLAFFRSSWRIKVSKLMIDVLAFSNATSLSNCDNFGKNIS
jgi:hypothetical protein